MLCPRSPESCDQIVGSGKLECDYMVINTDVESGKDMCESRQSTIIRLNVIRHDPSEVLIELWKKVQFKAVSRRVSSTADYKTIYDTPRLKYL